MMGCTDNHFRTLARLLTRHAWLYTEMVVAETILHQEENLVRYLEFPESHHPLVLQLGGSNLSRLGKAARLAISYGYDEINLNCGCPSEKVAGHGCFGACLMLNPELVGHCMAAIAENCNVPVSVKCRIGVDDFDSYDQLYTFVNTVSLLSPTKHFIIHARKAILKGLSPVANRNVPPLKYGYAFSLIRDFPSLQFTLNGGITSIQQAGAALHKGAFGVMLGRAAYNSPWSTLAHVDNIIYGEPGPGLSRRQILEHYADYADSIIGKSQPRKMSIRNLVKPLLHLFHAEPGAGIWRRTVDEALSHCKCFDDLLKETLPAVPKSVLDASPSLGSPSDHSPFSDAMEFPERSHNLDQLSQKGKGANVESC
eukprot:c24254_g1_i1 orf=267-1370(-)